MLRTNALMHMMGMRPLLREYVFSLSPALVLVSPSYVLSEGYPADTVDMWISEAQKELMELKVRLYSRWSFAWAERK
jgi:hypothetical protein